MTNGNSPPGVQRAIVLQGGGALGAYDAGVLKALCERIHYIDGNNRKKKNVFDILAGTSSGAINASIISGIVGREIDKAEKEGNEPDFENIWDNAIERLEEFWTHLSVLSEAEKDLFFDQRWETYKKFNESAASPEAARRWYATRQFLQYGVENVFKAAVEIRDEKFFDRFNTWYQYDNSPLRNSLKECDCFPIASRLDKRHPRLLMVAVDVKDGVAVTFDSYEKSDGSRFSEYDGESGSKHRISYNDGITEDHVMASASVPVNYGYAELKDSSNAARHYWDGGWLSNTPLRELIGEHQSFWVGTMTDAVLDSDMWKEPDQRPRKVPDVRVYITNVWPRAAASLPQDHDKVVERSRDMFFLDKTDYDEKVANLVDDYISLVKEMRKLGLSNASNKAAYNKVLTGLMNSTAATSEDPQKGRRNVDLIKGRLDVRVHRIQLAPDEDSISAKFFDFSRRTIEKLMEKGFEDGQKQFKDIFSEDR
jgi:predicted acylesterase/phospholipase RssA